MKKILGLTAALAAVLGCSSMMSVHAESAPVEPAPETGGEVVAPEAKPVVPATFAEIQTAAKINMRYVKDSNEVLEMKVKFGGIAPASLFNTKDKDYGMLVLDTANDPKAKDIDSLTKADIDEYLTKHMALPFDETIDKQAGNENVEYYWVIKNTITLGFDKEFTAVMYEITGNDVVLSKPTTYSTFSIVDKYIAMEGNSAVDSVKPVLNDFKVNYKVQYKVTSGFLYENTPGYSGDNWFDLKIVDHNGNYLGTAKPSADFKEFTFAINHNADKIRFQYWNTGTDNKARESKNINIVNGNLELDEIKVNVTWNAINSNMEWANYYDGHRKIYLRVWNDLSGDDDWILLDEPLDKAFSVNSVYTKAMVVIKNTSNGKDSGPNFNGEYGKTYPFNIQNGELVK